MRKAFSPGNYMQPCEVEYDIAIWPEPDKICSTPVCIFVRQLDGKRSLVNSQECLNRLLTRILATDLEGISTEFVHFVVASEPGCDSPSEKPHVLELKFQVDIEDYPAKDNRKNVLSIPDKTIVGEILNSVTGNSTTEKRGFSVGNHEVVGGCAKFCVNYEDPKPVPPEILDKLYVASGVLTPRI